jgi:8-oxo-dGTP pyrophosphatase MutT (NUDIX family)
MRAEDAGEVVRLAARVALSRIRRQRTAGGVGVLFNPRGEVLLTLAQYRRGWSFPGGYFEPHESGSEGITRELMEEVGYGTDYPTPIVVHVSDRPTHREHFAVAELTQDQADRLHPTSWEVRGLRWCNPNTMPRLHPFATALLSDGEGVVSRSGSRWITGPAAVAARRWNGSPE